MFINAENAEPRMWLLEHKKAFMDFSGWKRKKKKLQIRNEILRKF